ncbi:MAG TPA: ECF-type sigma factor [Planctomycetota bacterium]|nr:ECF-type sigma factor [Planctomycetota bacterium]
MKEGRPPDRDNEHEAASSHDVSILLGKAATGDAAASDSLMPLVYGQLHRIAEARMRSLAPGQTLQATALVHEAYVRILGKEELDGLSRRHFFFLAARAMRDILVERARSRLSKKRGGELRRVEMEDVVEVEGMARENLLDLEAVLQRLEVEDAEGHRIVMLRFYAGLTHDEIADLLDVTTRTVERRWRFLRSWLASELES